MTKTKQTSHGSSSSHRSRGMATARFTSTQREKPEDITAGDESQDSQDWPDFDNPEGRMWQLPHKQEKQVRLQTK